MPEAGVGGKQSWGMGQGRKQRLIEALVAELAVEALDTDVSNGRPQNCGRYHFFEATSFRMALSSIAAASSFFSRAFSSSSAFSRLASDTSRPPYLAFPL